MNTNKLLPLKMYHPTYDEEGVGMYERNCRYGWHSSAEVKARDDAIRNILIKVYNLNRPLNDARAYETMKTLLPLIEELEVKR